MYVAWNNYSFVGCSGVVVKTLKFEIDSLITEYSVAHWLYHII